MFKNVLLGNKKYLFDLFQNYDKAKIHFTLGKEYGNFNSSMQLLKVECLLQPINKFPYVQTLNKMYNDFQNPKRKLTILIHILMYYNYYDYNPKKIMIYLKLYVDQDIEDSIKKRQLMVNKSYINHLVISIIVCIIILFQQMLKFSKSFFQNFFQFNYYISIYGNVNFNVLSLLNTWTHLITIVLIFFSNIGLYVFKAFFSVYVLYFGLLPNISIYIL